MIIDNPSKSEFLLSEPLKSVMKRKLIQIKNFQENIHIKMHPKLWKVILRELTWKWDNVDKRRRFHAKQKHLGTAHKCKVCKTQKYRFKYYPMCVLCEENWHEHSYPVKHLIQECEIVDYIVNKYNIKKQIPMANDYLNRQWHEINEILYALDEEFSNQWWEFTKEK